VTEFIGGLDQILNPKLRVVVLTGAGVSMESGVPIFRGKGSMWENEVARNLAERSGPPWNTKETWEYYEWWRSVVSKCEPNLAHLTLAKMEKELQNFCLITQNIDGLHTRAGNKRVYELHGNIWRGRCLDCGKIVDLPKTPLGSLPPCCECGAALRPDVIEFGESLNPATLRAAIDASEHAEIFLVVGTSGVVSPARDMPLIALEKGATVVEINRDPSALTPLVTRTILEKASEILPGLWKEFLEKKK